MARLFFALWPDQDAAVALASLGRALAEATRGRALPAQNLHLTLVFLGEVEAGKFGSLHRAAGRVAGRPFTLVLDQTGSFPRSAVAWAGCRQPPPELLDLQSSLLRELETEGFAPEERRYSPHVTLVRRIGAAVATAPMAPISWRATALALVESARDRGGYAILAQWPLGQEGKEETPVAR